MIDLDKAGAWDAKEQLEIAEVLRNPTDEMADALIELRSQAVRYYSTREAHRALVKDDFKVMIDAATGGESDGNKIDG